VQKRVIIVRLYGPDKVVGLIANALPTSSL